MAQLLLGWAGLRAEIRRAEPDRTEFARVAEPLDNLIRVELEGGRPRRGWILFEALASWPTGYEKTVRHHWEDARRAGKTALPVVLVLNKGHGRTTMKPWEVVGSRAFGITVEAFGFVVVKLWEIPSRDALAGAPLVALPFLPFTRDASEATVRAGFDKLWMSKDKRRNDWLVALAVHALQVFPDQDWLGTIPVETLMKWRGIEQLKEMLKEQLQEQVKTDERLDAKRELAAELLRDRFDARTAASLVARLDVAADQKVTRATKLIASTTDDAYLVAALKKLLPPRKNGARRSPR